VESDAVVAVLDVDGHEMRPRRVAFRDRGGQLAENAVRSRPWRDVQVQLDTANDAGVVTVTVYSRPLMWSVWLGAILVAAGAVTPAWRRRPSRRPLAGPAFVPAAR
jgi:cytochrome c biogenesis factor